MKQLFIVLLFNLVIFSSLAQVTLIEKWPQFVIDTNSSFEKNQIFNTEILEENSQTNIPIINRGNGIITNVNVSRNPEDVLITSNDQFAYIRCRLSNTIEILKIPTGKIIKKLIIPHPSYFVFSNDTSKLYIASFTDFMIPPNPPESDCNITAVPGSGFTFLTTIDVSTQEIKQIDTVNINSIRKILLPDNDSMVYLVDRNVVEYNLNQKLISREWKLSQQIRMSKIDNKNNRILITTNSVESDSLNVIDIETGEIFIIPYYKNGDESYAGYIGLDTASSRIFIQGKLNPSEVLVFNAVTLKQISTIHNVRLFNHCFIVCPSLGSFFIGGDSPHGVVELDYFSLDIKDNLPTLETNGWKTIYYNYAMNKLYSFKYGGLENSINLINPPQKMDVLEYDLNTGETLLYETTDSIYGCSYPRNFAITHHGDYILATNSPENTVSIIKLSPESVNEVEINKYIDIYPNPATTFIEIRLNKEFDSDYQTELYNMYGEMLMRQSRSKRESNFTIDLSKYPKGQYFVHFKSLAQTRTVKIIKM